MKFNCTECGACCRLVPSELLAKYGLPEKETGGCGHLVDNKCVIYETRPDICDVRKTWEKKHSSLYTWDKYKELTEEMCLKLQGVESGKSSR